MEDENELKLLSDSLEGMFLEVEHETKENSLRIQVPISLTKTAFNRLRNATDPYAKGNADWEYMRKFCKWVVAAVEVYMWEQLNELEK